MKVLEYRDQVTAARIAIRPAVAADAPSIAEVLRQAFADYQRTRFGGWPWQSDEPVHGRDEGRFARQPDGRIERPG